MLAVATLAVVAAGCASSASTTPRYGYGGIVPLYKWQDGYVEDRTTSGPPPTYWGEVVKVPGAKRYWWIPGTEEWYTFAGPQGPTGVAGAMGPQGTVGVAGKQGPAGPQGVAGVSGPAGTNGKLILL